MHLIVDNRVVKEDLLEIEEQKVEHLNEDELREAIEINVREWADRNLQISWEVADDEQPG